MAVLIVHWLHHSLYTMLFPVSAVGLNLVCRAARDLYCSSGRVNASTTRSEWQAHDLVIGLACTVFGGCIGVLCCGSCADLWPVLAQALRTWCRWLKAAGRMLESPYIKTGYESVAFISSPLWEWMCTQISLIAANALRFVCRMQFALLQGTQMCLQNASCINANVFHYD